MAILSFLYMTYKQYLELNPQDAYSRLIEEDRVRNIGPWDVEFYQCGGSSLQISSACLKLNTNRVMLRLSNPSETYHFINHSFAMATHARIKHKLSYQDLDWIASKPLITIMMPKMLHDSTSLKFGEKTLQVNFGNGSNSVFTVNSRILHQTGTISFDIRLKEGNKIFGPQYYPIGISAPKDSETYLELEKKQAIVSQLRRQIEITVPAFLAAMSLIFDHAPSMHLVTLYSITRTVQSHLYDWAKKQGVLDQTHIHLLLVFINSIGFVLLLLLTMKMSRFATFSNRLLLVVTSILFSFGMLLGTLSLSSAAKHLLYLDCIGSGLAIVISITAIIKNSFQKRVRHFAIQLKTDYFSNKFFYYARMLVLLLGLGLSFFLASEDLLYLSNLEIDQLNQSLKHHLLVPILLFTIFLELGSTVNWMERMTKSLKQRFRFDQDIEIGKELQFNLLPPKKINSENYRYRILFSPVRPISGSYHDISFINLKRGENKNNSKRFAVVLQAELPGQGFSAALMTNIIASHWGIWKKSLELRPIPSNSTQLKEYIHEAALRIREGISVLKLPGAISLCIALIDMQEKVIAYSNYGSTPILVGSSKNKRFKTLSTKSMRLDPHSDLTDFQAKMYQLSDEDSEFIFLEFLN